MMDILYLIIGAAAGFAAAWFISKAKFNKGVSEEEEASLKQDLVNLSSELKVKDERLNFTNIRIVLNNGVELNYYLKDMKKKLIDAYPKRSMIAWDWALLVKLIKFGKIKVIGNKKISYIRGNEGESTKKDSLMQPSICLSSFLKRTYIFD